MNKQALSLGVAYAITESGGHKFRGVKRAVILETGTLPDNSRLEGGEGRKRGVKVQVDGEDHAWNVSTYGIIMRWDDWTKLTTAEQIKLVPSCAPKPPRKPTNPGGPRGPYRKREAMRPPREGDRLGFVPVVDGQPRITHLSAFYDYDRQREGCYVVLEDGRVLVYRGGEGAWHSITPIPAQINTEAVTV